MRQHGLSANGELIVLQRFHGGVRVQTPEADEPIRALLFVDVETTGLSPGRDVIIEWAAALVDVAVERGVVVGHRQSVSWFEDPGRPIPEEITRLTGITDRDVAGRRLPDAEVRTLYEAADLVVAHNARFDRAMCAARFGWLGEPSLPPWGCSLRQIDWRGYGHRHADLESLAKDHGFFFSAHRATTDVEALIKLLGMSPDVADAPPYLAELIADARRPYSCVAASGTPYEARDELRARGYRWDAEAKHWHSALPTDRLDAELAWIVELCRRYGAGRPLAAELPFRLRFDSAHRPAWTPR